MSSPSSVVGNNGPVGIREGTRVILREITANLQNSPPGQSPRRKSGNEASPLKGEPQQQQQPQQQQHDVKVRFIREFADVGSTVREATAESSISSASSFQSLTSTLSSKCSSGICVDSSPGKGSDTSYLSADIPGLDDLISACENIRLADTTVDLSKDQSFSLQLDGEDFSGDQTFASATDGLDLDRTRELSRQNSPTDFPRCAEGTAEVAGELDRTRTFDGKFAAELDRTRTFDGKFAAELDRTRTFDGEFAGELDRTRTFDAEAEPKNPEDAEKRYLRADSEIEKSVDVTFVQCSSTVGQEIPVVLVNGATEEVNDRAEINDSRETLETFSELDTVETSPVGEKFDKSKPTTLAEIVEEFDKSKPATLAEIVEELPEPLTDISAEEAKRLILNDTLELSTPQFFDEAKRLIQLDKTIELSTPQFFDFAQNSTDFESSALTAEGAAQSEKFSAIDGLRPSTLSDIEETSQSSTLPSLPSLSSVRLPAEVTQTDVVDESHGAAPIETAASLSEKFAQIVAEIAANDICTANSISAIKEPTFLNSPRNANDSADSQENKSDESIEKADDIINPREQNTIERIAEIQSRELEIETAEIARESVETISRIAESVGNIEAALSPVKTEAEAVVVKVEPEEPSVQEFVEKREADSSAGSDNLNATVTINDISAGNLFSVPESDQYAEFLPQQQSTGLVLDRRHCEPNKSGTLEIAGASSIIDDNFAPRPISPNDEYAAFVPQKQSTGLASCFGEPLSKLERQATPFVTALLPPIESSFNGGIPTSPKSPRPVDDRCNFAKLEIAANAVANDIYNKSLELEEESDRFVSATGTELFVDPGGFDFLLSKTPRKNCNSNLRTESLYIKFDPLVSNTSMLPQGNIHNTSPPVNEERNGENNTTIANLSTPKRNPALAAIDRLLFYSPMTNNTPTTNTATIQKTNDVQEKVEPTEETSAETVNMAKELELVRSTVIQLEDQLEKLKIDNEEKQTSYQEKINQLQAQLAQEIKNKNQITVVVDEYEKSISRLVAERERDRKNLDLEKAKLQEELAAAKHHLDNTEAAFNDVHLKYERLKAVVATYKNNEIALKESLQENVEIIKSLENRYEQVKSHATARLEKANQDLDAIRKQNESETVRLHAMLRKAELKSNSLAELVEQKTKENKELTQILDEVIARVGRKQSE